MEKPVTTEPSGETSGLLLTWAEPEVFSFESSKRKMYHALSFCLVTSLDIHLWHISHKPMGSRLFQWNTVKTRESSDIVPHPHPDEPFNRPPKAGLFLILNFISISVSSIFCVNSQLFEGGGNDPK